MTHRVGDNSAFEHPRPPRAPAALEPDESSHTEAEQRNGDHDLCCLEQELPPCRRVAPLLWPVNPRGRVGLRIVCSEQRCLLVCRPVARILSVGPSRLGCANVDPGDPGDGRREREAEEEVGRESERSMCAERVGPCQRRKGTEHEHRRGQTQAA